MKTPLLVKDLVSLEAYAREHEEYRAEVLTHQVDRTVRVGLSATLQFEDELTVRWRIQESIRIEGLAGDEAIQARIDACAPLIPEANDLRATLKIALPQGADSAARLAQLPGIEGRVWLQFDGSDRVFAVAEARAPDGRQDGLSGVHWLRFDLDEPLLESLAGETPLSVGIDHAAYSASVVLGEATRESLRRGRR